MKRIISVIAIIAIVSSALAFTSKKCGVFCAAATSGGSCNIISGVTEVNNGTSGFTRYKNCNWNGSSSTCTGPVCTTQTTFYNE